MEQPRLASNWWELFGDPDLNGLERTAIVANPDVKAAMERVIEARAAAGVVASQFYPVVGADPSVTRSRAGALRRGSKGTTSTDIRIPFDVSYEVDIWGRVSRSVEAANAQTAQFAADFAVVLQTLEADLAEDYFNLRSLDSQDLILRQTTESYRHQLALTQQLLEARLDSPLEVAQVRTLLEQAIAQEVSIRQQRAVFEHAIAVLIGRPPSAVSIPVRALDITPPYVPAGLPAAMLGRRPDVAEAEQTLVQANAQVGVAIADFYPTVTLTGAAGFESFDLQHLANWQSTFLSFGPDVSVPLFTGGRLSASLQQAKARYEEVLANYRKSLLTAFQDVEDALSNLHLQAEQEDAQSRAVDAAREYYNLSLLQQQQGLLTMLQLIDADRTLLSSELALAQVKSSRLVSTVLLIKALGGGWNPRQPTTRPATQPAALTFLPPAGLPTTMPATAP